MLAGVAGGLAEIWDADPSLVRIVWALLTVLTGGLALVVYIVMAIVVPEEDATWPMTPANPTTPDGDATPAGDATTASAPVVDLHAARREARAARRAARGGGSGLGTSGAMIAGLVLVAVGAFFLVREFLPQIDFDWFWPAMLIVLGVVLLVTALGRTPRDPGSAP